MEQVNWQRVRDILIVAICVGILLWAAFTVMGLFVHAGHGLTYRNVVPVAAIPEIEELNIGHSIVSRAVMVGMPAAVGEMVHLVRGARR